MTSSGVLLVVIALELLVVIELLRQVRGVGTGAGYVPLLEIVKGWLGR